MCVKSAGRSIGIAAVSVAALGSFAASATAMTILGVTESHVTFAPRSDLLGVTWSRDLQLGDQGLALVTHAGAFDQPAVARPAGDAPRTVVADSAAVVTMRPMPIGVAWRLPSGVRMSVEFTSELTGPLTSVVQVRTSVDRLHWSAYRDLAPAPAPRVAPASGVTAFEGDVQIDTSAFDRLFEEWQATHPAWTNDEEAFFRWVTTTQSNPAKLLADDPGRIGYVQVRIVFRRGAVAPAPRAAAAPHLLLKNVTMKCIWAVGGLHTVPPSGIEPAGAWRFDAQLEEARSRPLPASIAQSTPRRSEHPSQTGIAGEHVRSDAQGREALRVLYEAAPPSGAGAAVGASDAALVPREIHITDYDVEGTDAVGVAEARTAIYSARGELLRFERFDPRERGRDSVEARAGDGRLILRRFPATRPRSAQVWYDETGDFAIGCEGPVASIHDVHLSWGPDHDGWRSMLVCARSRGRPEQITLWLTVVNDRAEDRDFPIGSADEVLQLHVFDEKGERVACSGAGTVGAGGAARPGDTRGGDRRMAFTPGSARNVDVVELGALCANLRPGRYEAFVTRRTNGPDLALVSNRVSFEIVPE